VPNRFGNGFYNNFTGQWAPVLTALDPTPPIPLLSVADPTPVDCIFPEVLSVTKTIDNTSALSHTVTLPSFNAGDRLILLWGDNFNNSRAVTTGGWTEVLDVSTSSIFVAYRDMDGTEASTITVTNTPDSTEVVHFVVRLKVDTFDKTKAPEGVHTLNGADPADCPSLTPTWGRAKALWIAFCATDSTTSPITLTSAPYGYRDYSDFGETGGTAAPDSMAGYGIGFHDSATQNPATFTMSVAESSWDTATIAIKGYCPIVKPPLLTNANTLYAHTVSIASGLTIVAPLLTNSNTLYAHKIAVTLKPALLTNSNTLYAHKIAVTLKPALLTNSNTLYAHKIAVTLKPALLTNTNTLYAHAIIAGAIAPPLLTNSNTLYAHKITVTLKPALLTNTNTLNAHAIVSSGVVAPLLVNPNILYGHTVLSGASLPAGGFGGFINYERKKRLDEDELRRRARRHLKKDLFDVTIKPPLLTNVSVMYAPGLFFKIWPLQEETPEFSPQEIDEILDTLDALDAIEALEGIEAMPHVGEENIHE
jgi:hypothetical protein